MENTIERLNALFQEWKKRGGFDDFCRDGVHYHHASEQERYNIWHSTPTRVLFIAKEPRDRNGDVAENWSKSSFGVDKYTRCQYLYINKIQGQPFDQVKEKAKDSNAIKEFLESNPFCWINVKKTQGGRSAVGKQIVKHIETFGDLLLEEIKILNPTHVVCLCGGNNGAVVEKLKSLPSHPKIYTAYHPAYWRRSRESKYNSLTEIE